MKFFHFTACKRSAQKTRIPSRADFSGEEIGLVDAVDRPVFRHFGAGEFRQRREQVDGVHDLVADASGRHLARPADHERHADAAFPGSEVLALPRSRPSIPVPDEFGPVVAGENHDGVVADAEPVHGIEHLADIVIHLGQHVGPVAVAGLAGECRIRQRRQMRLRHRRVGEEWLLRLDLALHEGDRPPRNLGVDQPPLLEVVHLHIAARLALAASMSCSGGMIVGE